MSQSTMLYMQGLTEAKIAAVLRDNPTPEFCNALAMLLDPHPRKRPLYRLELKRARSHRPKGTQKHAAGLGEAMLDEIAGLARGEAKARKAEIAERFGVSVRTAEAAAKRERELRELAEWSDQLRASK